MSASSKKKLRKEQEAPQLTAKQLAAQKEASTTRLYTIAFVVVLIALLAVAIFVGVRQTIKNTGYYEKRTTALQIDDHVLSNAELNYFYIDAVNNFYSNYGNYASMFGLDLATPLNQQFVDEESGRTWADDFLESAVETAKDTYAMVDAAEAAGFTLPEKDAEDLENNLNTLEVYAKMYGFKNGEAYLKAMYGSGASKEGYREYTRCSALANAYYNHYSASLTYDDAALREKEAGNEKAYNSFTYNSYYLPLSNFQAGGETDAEGNTTYTAEETAAAEAAMKAAAESLIAEEIDSVEALDAAIAALAVNEGTEASSNANKNVKYNAINSLYQQWVSDSSRKAGDKELFISTGTDDSVTGCHVVYYLSSTDNKFPMVNVRHILVKPEHAADEADGAHEGAAFSAEELAAAKASAEEILAKWQGGEATEDSFALLANELSADGDGTTGGLYENVVPGQMVTAFNDWCFDSSRKAGDTGIVETEYGFHVMYFVGLTDLTYRDYQITSELRSADLQKWHEDVLAAVNVTEGNTKYLRKDLVLKAN